MKTFDNIVSYFFYFSLAIIFIFIAIYFFYFWSKKKSFHSYSINTQIKSILSVALLSAVSVAFIFVFSQFSSIMVIPSVRVAFEGVLVKIAGFLFGPIIGITSALITELAVLIFIPTYFHYKFLLVLISFGAFSGLVKVFLTAKAKTNWLLFLIYVGSLFFFSLTLFFFYASLQSQSGFSLSFLDWNEFIYQFQKQYLTSFNFQTIIFYSNLLVFVVLFGFLTWTTCQLNTNTKKLRWINKKTLLKLLPIVVLTVFSEYFISVFIATSANQSVFGETTQGGFILFTSAIALAPIKIVVNTFIIYQVWSAFHFHLKKEAFNN